MENIIRIENLIFEYMTGEDDEKVRAIDDVSLSIERGSFTAIIGRNGSGKSTLAKNLNGLLLPSGGRIFVRGWDTSDDNHIWDVRQSAGMVFQNPENLGIDPVEIRRRVDDALTAVNMGKYKKKSPHMLSGGQKQRIAIAGVVAMKPECIIFDEPTAMLDPKGREEIMEIIRQLHDEGITVVLITHFMDEAVQADRIIIMDRGHVLLDGTPEEVFAQEETIREASLDLPLAVELAQKLRKRGIKIPKEIITAEGLVEFICQYK